MTHLPSPVEYRACVPTRKLDYTQCDTSSFLRRPSPLATHRDRQRPSVAVARSGCRH